jgi:hypothetical protein
MGGKVFIFNLPPKLTCTPTYWCLHGKNGKPSCYAQRNNFLLNNAIESSMIRYRLSLNENFVENMVKEINRKESPYVRIHSSGDFYSKEYAQKLISIAKQCPDKLFRTSTRRRDLSDVLQELNSLPNFIVRESLDAEKPTPAMGLNFATLSHLPIAKKEKTYFCVDDCVKCNYYCWKRRVNVAFKEF